MVHIGGRRQVRDNAARLARNLETISRCNRALFQACDEQELLQLICRILVETAQIDLAWIGYCKGDAEKTVRPIASAGNGVCYLTRIDHSWCLTRAGEGPVGKAIRTGRRCWVEDIRTDPIFSNGRTEALTLGYVSCLALPLIAAIPTGTPLDLRGALTLYATAHDSFDESEVGRYEDLASYLTCTIARLRSHLALRRSEEQLRLAIDTVPTLVWSCAPDGSLDFINPRWMAYTGLSAKGAARTTVHPEDRDKHLDKWRVCLATGEPFESEARLQRAADGEWRWLSIHGMPLRDETGNIVRWYGTATDIEDRKRAEEGRQDAQNKLAHANRVTRMGQLTASIAHEVNQPVAAAVTNAHAALRWLGAERPDLEEVRQALGRIVENGNRAGEVIDRIRALIKNAPPRKDCVAINDAILEVVALSHGEAMKSDVSVRTKLAEDLPPIEGDRVQLQQVILNLIINAFEAMSGTNEAPRELLISTGRAESDGVLVVMRDSGPELAPATLERLFDAFYTTKENGLGLGLSICRSIIEAHGGRLWAIANLPRGAVFQFTIPARPGTVS